MKIIGWYMMLPYVMAAYQSSRHEVTKYTPNYLMLEQKVHTPVVMYTKPIPSNYDDYAEEVGEWLKRAYSYVNMTSCRIVPLKLKELF